MRENEVQIISNGDMSGNITGSSYDMSQSFGYKVYFTWTGSPTGTVKMQGSLDGSIWYDIPDSGASGITGGTSGSLQFKDATCMDIFVRPVFTFSSGTGTLNVQIAKKGF